MFKMKPMEAGSLKIKGLMSKAFGLSYFHEVNEFGYNPKFFKHQEKVRR
jgi:hypothetical protein